MCKSQFRKREQRIFSIKSTMNRGALIGEGFKKPSQFGVLYAFISMFFESEIISLTEKYDYRFG
jgi:hypothetical protein